MPTDELKKLSKQKLIEIIQAYFKKLSYLQKRLDLIEEIYCDE